MENSKQPDSDFEELRKSESWFFKESDEIEFMPSDFEVSGEFQRVFPKLTTLIESARVQDLKINDQSYRLFSWTVNGKSCGWLSIFEGHFEGEIQLIDEHRLVLNEIGGIATTYNDFNDIFPGGQKFIFTESRCSKELDGWDGYYDERCEEDEIPETDKIDYKDFIVFAQEANGDVTTYDSKSKEVMQFNHDGDITDRNGEYITEEVENQPEGTFYTIKGVKYFIDYVERFAEEYINLIHSKHNILHHLLEQRQFDEAIQLTETITDSREKSKFENLIGIAYFYAADFKKALEFYVKALKTGHYFTDILDFNIWEVCGELMKEENDKRKWSEYYLSLFPNGKYTENAKMNV